MDAMEVAAVLRRAADKCDGCYLASVATGSDDCPDCSCSQCKDESAAWFRDAADAIERCALPGGVEWPVVGGRKVDFKTAYEPGLGALEAVCIYSNGACEVMSHDGIRKPVSEIRPVVLAADGEPLEAGQTVWEVDGTGHPFKVVSIRPSTGRAMEPTVVTCDVGDGTSEHILPSQLTHQRPVLDADGVPIKVGQTAWGLDDGREWTVSEIINGTVSLSNEDGIFHEHSAAWEQSEQLTHVKPEPPDKACEDCAYFAKDPNAGTMGACFAKTVRYGSNKFAYKFTCRWNPTCEKYEERGGR